MLIGCFLLFPGLAHAAVCTISRASDQRLCHGGDWTYYSCNCPACNLTLPCASDNSLLNCACPPGSIDDSNSLFVYPAFSIPWLTRLGVLDIVVGGFFGMCWNMGMFPNVAAMIAFIWFTVRTKGCRDKSLVDSALNLVLAIAFVSPGVALPLGTGPCACVLAWCVPGLYTYKWLRLNRARIMRDHPAARQAARPPAERAHGASNGADRVSAASVPVGRPVLVEMGVNEIRPTTETDGDAESTTDGTVAVVSRGPVPGRVIPTAVVASLPAPVATPATTEAAGSPSARIDGHAVSLAERLRQLDDALTEGVLTAEEHRLMKERILDAFAAGALPAAAIAPRAEVEEGRIVQSV